mmetsp:Transcript_20832/g.62310  ORF Transcript_20832/g.62310 Transcript_20832/m.62310 type:complete len:253 (-) Transcript_20832:261-1019(-)
MPRREIVFLFRGRDLGGRDLGAAVVAILTSGDPLLQRGRTTMLYEACRTVPGAVACRTVDDGRCAQRNREKEDDGRRAAEHRLESGPLLRRRVGSTVVAGLRVGEKRIGRRGFREERHGDGGRLRAACSRLSRYSRVVFRPSFVHLLSVAPRPPRARRLSEPLLPLALSGLNVRVRRILSLSADRRGRAGVSGGRSLGRTRHDARSEAVLRGATRSSVRPVISCVHRDDSLSATLGGPRGIVLRLAGADART